jgi:hypothetical protein
MGSTKSGALPGKSLVVFDPQLELAIDVFPCEDGHAQERSLLDKVLLTVMHKDLWIADSCFVRKIFCLVFKNGVVFLLFVSINKYLWWSLTTPYLLGLAKQAMFLNNR